MHSIILSLAALTASFALAQSDASCIAMCLQVKFVESEELAPSCARSDLACLCSSTTFGNAYRRCLSDNCASTDDTESGKALFGQICSQAGVAVGSITAQTDEGSKATAVAEVASLLQASISGTAPVPPASFLTDSALAYATAYQGSQAAMAASSIAAQVSRAEASASASLAQEAGQLSASFAQVVRAASATQARLSAVLPSSAYAEATQQIAATLSAIQAAASSKLDADRAAAESLLASHSASLAGGLMAQPSNAATNALSSSALRLELQAGLGLAVIVSGLVLSGVVII